jgi:hypothetical protein
MKSCIFRDIKPCSPFKVGGQFFDVLALLFFFLDFWKICCTMLGVFTLAMTPNCTMFCVVNLTKSLLTTNSSVYKFVTTSWHQMYSVGVSAIPLWRQMYRVWSLLDAKCNLLCYRRHHSIWCTRLFTTPLVVITISGYNEFWPSDVVSWGGPFISSLFCLLSICSWMLTAN